MNVARRPSPTLIEVLRSTLVGLEGSREFNVDDPALREFKRSLLRLIADLQLRKESKSRTPEIRPAKGSHSVLTLIVKPGGKPRPAQD
jgi:hypothetical protein